MAELTIWVPGIPQPQGSIQYKGRTRRGKPILTSDNANLKPWRQMITWRAQSHARVHGLDVLFGQRDAIEVEVHFVLARPQGHFGVKGNVLPSAPTHHLVKPDIDKLCRAVLDALTDAAIFRDDSQVVRILTSKSYTTTAPGAAITVRQASQPPIPAQEQAHGSTRSIPTPGNSARLARRTTPVQEVRRDQTSSGV